MCLMSEDYIHKSVDVCPVIPDADSLMELVLAVCDRGKIYVFHNQRFLEQISWAEFDLEQSRIFFVTELGRIQGLGIDIEEVMQRTILEISPEINLVLMENKIEKELLTVPLVIRNTIEC